MAKFELSETLKNGYFLLENNDKFYGRMKSYRKLNCQEKWERSIQNSQMQDYFEDGIKQSVFVL